MSRPRVLVLQHASHCTLGMLAGLIEADGIAPDTVELNENGTIPDLSSFDILIALGGPMNVWETEANPWLIRETQAIRTWVEDLDRPFLGICLGHQLLASALGGDVRPAEITEADVCDIRLSSYGLKHPLLRGFGPSKRAVSMHGCEVVRLPPGARLLGSTDNCQISAFAVGSAAFGVQYHFEADSELVIDWTDREEEVVLVERHLGVGGVATLRSRVSAAMPELRENARCLYRNFMDIAARRR